MFGLIGYMQTIATKFGCLRYHKGFCGASAFARSLRMLQQVSKVAHVSKLLEETCGEGERQDACGSWQDSEAISVGP